MNTATDVLDTTMQIPHDLDVKDFVRYQAHLSKKDAALLKLHLNIANIIINDAKVLQTQFPQKTFKEITRELIQTWKDNIQDLTSAMLDKEV